MGSDNGQHERPRSCIQKVCGCNYIPSIETLEYDYSLDSSSKKAQQQPLPRIRQRGEYYIDTFNAEPWSCSLGTFEEVSQHFLFKLFRLLCAWNWLNNDMFVGWCMDEFWWSSWVCYGNISLDIACLLCCNCYRFDSNRRDSTRAWDDIHRIGCNGTCFACQDITDGSWICAKVWRSYGKPKKRFHKSCYVWAMPNI